MRVPRGRGAEPTEQLRQLAGCGNEGPRPGLAPIRRRAGSGDGARRPRERRGSARVKAGGLVVGWSSCSLAPAIDAGARTGRLAHPNEPLRRPRHPVERERQPRQRWARPLGDSNPCDSRSGYQPAPPATEVEIDCQGPEVSRTAPEAWPLGGSCPSGVRGDGRAPAHRFGQAVLPKILPIPREKRWEIVRGVPGRGPAK